MVDKVIYEETKKFMWDGQAYEDKKSADAAAKEYEEKGFEVRVKASNPHAAVYTRRVVTDVVVDG